MRVCGDYCIRADKERCHAAALCRCRISTGERVPGEETRHGGMCTNTHLCTRVHKACTRVTPPAAATGEYRHTDGTRSLRTVSSSLSPVFPPGQSGFVPQQGVFPASEGQMEYKTSSVYQIVRIESFGVRWQKDRRVNGRCSQTLYTRYTHRYRRSVLNPGSSSRIQTEGRLDGWMERRSLLQY